MKLKDKVLKAIWKEDDKYKYIIAISACKEDKDNNNIRTNISFVLLDKNNNIYVEWIPKYGPITRIKKFDGTLDEYETKTDDYIFDYSCGRGGWSQLYCDDRRFNRHFIEGNYDYIFNNMIGFLE